MATNNHLLAVYACCSRWVAWLKAAVELIASPGANQISVALLFIGIPACLFSSGRDMMTG